MQDKPCSDGLQTPGYWRERADEVQGMAHDMLDLRARAALEDIAQKYRLLAELAADNRRLG